jgi:hypothetical protein
MIYLEAYVAGLLFFFVKELIGRKFGHEVSVFGFKDPGIKYRGCLWFTKLINNQ